MRNVVQNVLDYTCATKQMSSTCLVTSKRAWKLSWSMPIVCVEILFSLMSPSALFGLF